MTQRVEDPPRTILEPSHPHRRTPYDRFVRLGLVAWSGIGIILLGYLVLRLFGYASVVIPPLLLAAAVVFALNPLVSLLERRGVPRAAGATVVYLAFAGLIALLVALLVPLVTHQVGEVIDHAPTYVTQAQERARELGARFGRDVRFDVTAEQVQAWLSEPANRQTVSRYITGLGAFTTNVLQGMVVFLIGAIMAFYLLVDLPRLQRGARSLVPPGQREDLADLVERISRAVGGFFRGQLLVAIFVGVASSVGLRLVGLPYWLLVGILAGVFDLVPLLGPFIAGALAVVIALLNGQPWLALWAALVLLVVQQIDNHIISPNVMGRTVRLHPVVVMLALLLGATLGGVLGMLVVVPLVASAKIVLLFLWTRYVDYGHELVQAEGPNGDGSPARRGPPGPSPPPRSQG